MKSETKANIDGVKIKNWPHLYKAQDVQNRPLDIIGYSNYENSYIRMIEIAVVKQWGDNDIVLNLETLIKLGIVEYNFPQIDNAIFKETENNIFANVKKDE